MTWLTPLFLAAGLAVAGPILFHMWQRMPRGRRLFSSTMFLAPSPPRITHRSRIENWLLLLLRALALILLAVGFARPVWRMEAQAPAISSPDKTVAILVDLSASVQRAGFWESLTKQTVNRIDSLAANTNLALFAFDQRWQTIVPFDDAGKMESAARRQLVKDQLSSLKPAWGSTRLGHGLAQTMQAVREFEASRPVKEAAEIWLVSDLASGADLTGLAGIDWPETTKLELITPDIPPGTNAGLQWVETRADDKSSQLRVRISNAQASTKDRFRLGWESDTGGNQPIEVHVPAGQSRTVLAPPRPPEIPETAPLKLTGDDHEFDNRLWAAAGRRREVWVLYLGSDDAKDIASPRFFLEQAFAGTPDADVAMKSLEEITEAAASVDPPVLAVWTDAAVEPPAWLRDVLERGGSLLSVPKTGDDARQMLAYQGIVVDSVSEAEVKDFSLLNEIDFEDPLFAAFLQARFADFTGIHFWKHRRIKLPEDFPGRVLARFDDGDPGVIFQTLGAGRSWLLTSGWQAADSQLARSSKFAPLLQRMLEQSTPLTSGSARSSISSVISWPLSRSEGTITVRRPDATEDKQDISTAAYDRTDLPGIYVAARNSETASWAVNVAPEESKTDPLTKDALERLGVQTKLAHADRETILSPVQQKQLQLAELERRQAIWRWCLLGAAVLVLIETALAAKRSQISDLNSEMNAGDVAN